VRSFASYRPRNKRGLNLFAKDKERKNFRLKLITEAVGGCASTRGWSENIKFNLRTLDLSPCYGEFYARPLPRPMSFTGTMLDTIDHNAIALIPMLAIGQQFNAYCNYTVIRKCSNITIISLNLYVFSMCVIKEWKLYLLFPFDHHFRKWITELHLNKQYLSAQLINFFFQKNFPRL